jgi:phosphate transport system substrate-binding protein
VIGYDGVALIVHPSNPVGALSLDDVGRLYAGEIDDWAQLGGKPGRVLLYGRPQRSGTHGFFRDRVLRRGDPRIRTEFAAAVIPVEHTRDLVERVAAEPAAIGYVGLGHLDSSVKALAIAALPGGPAIVPSITSVRNCSYPIYRPLALYTRGVPSDETARFLRFVLSPAGRALIQRQGFVPAETSADLVPAPE